ncbi:MAG: DNA recombination protein RmuC [Candidatus Omnitrophota bacterium]
MITFWIIAGFVAGFIAAFLALKTLQTKSVKRIEEQFEIQRKANTDAILDNIKANFGDISRQALSNSTEEFLKLAKERLEREREAGVKELDAKKILIDRQLESMTSELDKVSVLVKDLEKDRVEKFGQLTGQLKNASEQTAALMKTTNMLQEALASNKARGAWGERMAEDVLRLAGFIEKVNYLKQKTIEEGAARPDFTFLLPKGRKLNMDVKFPLNNYKKFLETDSDIEKKAFRGDFLKDVKAHIKAVTSREYINPEKDTLDYVLLFIPNEQVYGFIHEQDNTIIDEALKNKVVFCSPLTLFAVLAVIRQALDNFALEHTSNEILSLLGLFKKQWLLFLEKMNGLGVRIEAVHKEYETLSVTRRRQLEKPLNRIEDIRKQRGLAAAGIEDNSETFIFDEDSRRLEN